MGDMIIALQSTPVPTILVVGGLVFLFLAVVGQFVGEITVPKERQIWAGLIGCLLLFSGVALYVAPVSPSVPTPTIVAAVTPDTPTPMATVAPTDTPTRKPTDTSAPKPPTNTPVEREEGSDSWISCDENMTVLERNFYWSGPAASSCDVSLGEGEFIVGTADRYGDKVNDPPEGTRCVAFALLGPLNTIISVNHGGGWRFLPGDNRVSGKRSSFA